MATLADSFLADLEELSDNDEAAQSDKDEATNEDEHGQVCSTHAWSSQASLSWTGDASAASTLLDSQCLPRVRHRFG